MLTKDQIGQLSAFRVISHKVVQAGKIRDIELMPDGSTQMVIDSYRQESIAITADDDWLAKHEPDVGGYLVVYEDGYISYSPAKAFETGYTPIGV